METASQPRARALRWLNGGQTEWGTRLADLDLGFVRRVANRLRPLFDQRGYFRSHIDGLEHLPRSPVLLVANHSGGSTLVDVAGLAYGYHQHFDFRRKLHILAHDILLAQRLTGPAFSRLGVLRATRDHALAVLSGRRDLLVMPGGDQDTWRPHRDRFKVCFHGHRGYARLALQAGVPIVPVACAGPHDTLVVLTQGRGIARRLRLHDLLRIDIFPVHLSLPWGLGIGPLPHLPWPAKFEYLVGKPIYPPRTLATDERPSPAEVLNHDATVRDSLQRLLDQLALRRGAGLRA